MNSRVIKKILLLNQRERDAVTCVAHILLRKELGASHLTVKPRSS